MRQLIAEVLDQCQWSLLVPDRTLDRAVDLALDLQLKTEPRAEGFYRCIIPISSPDLPMSKVPMGRAETKCSQR